MRILPPSPFHRGPFSATIQTRFKKHASTAQTLLETRSLVSKLDSLALHRGRLDLVLRLHALFLAKKRFPFVSVQILSRCSNHAGIDTLSAGGLLRKYPHVFQGLQQCHRSVVKIMCWVQNSGSNEKSIAVDKTPSGSKLQLQFEQKMRMKVGTRVRLRRKRLVRKHHVRKKGS